MRLKTFSAPTISEAMEMVRQQMGDEAIIVSTQKSADGAGARVVAASEEQEDLGLDDGFEGEPEDAAEAVRHALSFHGAPPRLAGRLAKAAGAANAASPAMAFASAVAESFAFLPLEEAKGNKPVMLVGPPGAGKTITCAKLAARASLAGAAPLVITTDTRRAGGVEQLAAFTRILGLDLKVADSAAALGKEVKKAAAGANGAGPGLVFIDTQGTNPFSDAEMEYLHQLVRASGAEPVLVLAAGGDALEMADFAASFAAMGAKRLLITRLDMARRLGGMLAAADAARMAFCNVSLTPHVADGLSPISPLSLARLLMPQSAGANETPYHHIEAAS